jgi:hypothetical protein
MTDESLIVGALYNNVHRTFLTAAGRGIKVQSIRSMVQACLVSQTVVFM